MKTYLYNCVNCGKSYTAYIERKTEYLCRDCSRIRDKFLEKNRKKAKKIKIILLKKRGHICEHCHNNFDTLDLHHVIPIIEGGDTSESNSLLLCKKCHKNIHAKNPSQWKGAKLLWKKR